MSEHFNGLTPAQAERLALLLEECGEVIQIVGKILRHGLYSWNPEAVGSQTNIELLERELGDLTLAIALMAEASEVSTARIWELADKKRSRVRKYLHHQDV